MSDVISRVANRQSFGPIPSGERIATLDVLRGFALIGVLYVNMHNFGSWVVSGPLHDAAETFMNVVFARKFFSLFSFLFGVGFAIQMDRASARGASFAPVYSRRLVVLFLIGCAHWLIYPGDILRMYAVLGFALFAFSRLDSRMLVTGTLLLFLVSPARLWL